MPIYKYTAIDDHGEKITGELEATDDKDLENKLSNGGLYLLEMQSMTAIAPLANTTVAAPKPDIKTGHCVSCGGKLGLWSRTVRGEDICPKCKDAQRESILQEYQQGNLPLVESTSLMLARDERCHLEYPTVLNEEVKVRKGGMGGFSFRIMKGVYYHTGRFKSEPTPEMREVDKGNLYITNERVVFAGDKQSLVVPFKKILGINGYKDGFSINWEGKKKPVIFSINDVDLVLSILAGAIYNYRTG